MSKEKPDNVAEFLFKQRPWAQKELLLKTAPDGKIKQIIGSPRHFSDTIKTGSSAGSIFSFLSTFFPVTTPGMMDLPRVFWKDFYLDIFIFSEQNLETWVLISDVSEAVNQVKENIQQHNTYALARKNQFSFESPFESLYLFNVATFIKVKDNKFLPLGSIPDWINKYFPQLALIKTAVDITETFPYIEIFLPEAEAHWKSGDEKLLESDIWIENPFAGVELHFRALATSKNGNSYLFIRQLDHEDIPVSQQTMQKAREHQLLYEKLQKAEKELKQLLYYKDKFVSIVSHDLRSPMASVVSIAEMFLTDDELMACMNDFNREMLVSMKEELERLLEYNNRLYHWANLELGNFKLDMEKIRVSKLVENVSNVARSKLEAKNIRYKTVVPEDFEVELDVSLFTQALNNLVGNAIKFTPEGGLITLEARRENGKVLFLVSDTGVGMPEKVRQSIFSGVPNASTLGTSGEKGSGLGLDIVKKIMDAHGFSIQVQSEEGKGTTFIISI